MDLGARAKDKPGSSNGDDTNVKTKAKTTGRSKPRAGTIYYIGLHNFMSYSGGAKGGVGFYPGTGVNAILGPNGAGKSSLATAVCVATGGNIDVMGRQTNLSQLVGANGKEARVRLKLHRDDDGRGDDRRSGNGPATWDVEVIIYKDRSRAPAYNLDGRQCGVEEVRRLCGGRLGVDPANPCQFLAQDVVRDFPALTPAQILLHSVRASGRGDTLDLLKTLKDLQERRNVLESTLIVKRSTLEHARKRLAAKAQMKKDLEEIAKMDQDLEFLYNYEKYVDVLAFRKEILKVQVEYKKKEEVMQEAEKNVSDMKDNMGEFESKMESFQRDAEDKEKRICEARKELIKVGEAALPRARITELEDKLASARDDLRRTRATVKKLEADILMKEAALDHFPSESDLYRLRSSLTEAAAEARSDLEKVRVSAERAEDERGFLARRLDGLIRDKVLSESEDNRKLEILKMVNQDAYKGTIWLRENQDLFKGKVHEPVMLLLKLRDENDARCLQHAIGKSDLEAFVCEEATDASELMRRLRNEQGLKRINIFHSDPATAANFKDFKCDLKPAGFRTFLSRCVKCPPAVLAHLCRSRRLHQLPVFDQSCKVYQALDKFSRFYVVDRYYSSRTNRYSKGKSVSVDDIGHVRLTHFLVNGRRPRRYFDNDDYDDDEENNNEVEDEESEERLLEKEIARAKKEKAEADREVKENNKAIAKAEEAFNTVDKERKAAAQKVSARMKAVTELRAAVKQLESKRSQLDKLERSRDDGRKRESKREEAAKELRKALSEGVKALEATSNITDEMRELLVLKGIASLKMDQLKLQNAQDLLKLEKYEKMLKTAEIDHRRLSAKRKREVKKLKKIEEGLEWDGAGGRWKVPSEIAARAAELLSDPNNAPRVKARIKILEDKKKEFPAVYSDTQKKDLANRERSVKKTSQEVGDMEAELVENVRFCREKERQLVTSLEELADKLNDSFSALAEKRGFAGCVNLLRGQDDLDFDGFGIEICVKFNETSGMNRLSSAEQSGGEKSLCTALYLLSLAKLRSSVPFRWVDELNQGMDEQNERFMWSVVLDPSESTGSKGQLFALAPKMPRRCTHGNDSMDDSREGEEQEGEYDDNVTYIIVNSGAVVKREKRFDLDTLLRRLKKSKSK